MSSCWDSHSPNSINFSSCGHRKEDEASSVQWAASISPLTSSLSCQHPSTNSRAGSCCWCFFFCRGQGDQHSCFKERSVPLFMNSCFFCSFVRCSAWGVERAAVASLAFQALGHTRAVQPSTGMPLGPKSVSAPNLEQGYWGKWDIWRWAQGQTWYHTWRLVWEDVEQSAQDIDEEPSTELYCVRPSARICPWWPSVERTWVENDGVYKTRQSRGGTKRRRNGPTPRNNSQQ